MLLVEWFIEIEDEGGAVGDVADDRAIRAIAGVMYL